MAAVTLAKYSWRYYNTAKVVDRAQAALYNTTGWFRHIHLPAEPARTWEESMLSDVAAVSDVTATVMLLSGLLTLLAGVGVVTLALALEVSGERSRRTVAKVGLGGVMIWAGGATTCSGIGFSFPLAPEGLVMIHGLAAVLAGIAVVSWGRALLASDRENGRQLIMTGGVGVVLGVVDALVLHSYLAALSLDTVWWALAISLLLMVAAAMLGRRATSRTVQFTAKAWVLTGLVVALLASGMLMRQR